MMDELKLRAWSRTKLEKSEYLEMRRLGSRIFGQPSESKRQVETR